MTQTYRVSTTSAIIVCLVISQWSGVLFASEQEPSMAVGSQPGTTTALLSDQVSAPARSRFVLGNAVLASTPLLNAPDAQDWRNTLAFVPTASDVFAQRRGARGRGGDRERGRGTGRRSGAATAVMIGAVASITGTAILVYANRPECSTNPYRADGCGYGTKVVGGAVLSVGLAGFMVAALTW